MAKLADKKALVTGAAGGIGKACAEELRHQGAVVVGLDINDTIATDMADADFKGLVLDLTDENAVQNAFAEVVDTYGGVDILISNTGIFRTGAAIENLSEVEYQLLSRLRVELAHLGKDQVLSGLIDRLADRVTGYVPPAQSPVVMATRYTFNGVTLSLFSTISQFGGVGEIAYADIKIEQLFPADEASRQLLLAMAGPET